MTAKAAKAAEVHLTLRQLIDAVTLVKPHVGNDDTLPMLVAYQVDERDGDLWVSTTDRYSAGSARIEPVKEMPQFDGPQRFPRGFHAVIPARQMTLAITAFKSNRRDPFSDPRVRIIAKPVTETSATVSIEVADRNDGTIRLQFQDVGKVPSILDLLHGMSKTIVDNEAAPAALTAFRPEILARLLSVSKVLGRNACVRMRQVSASRPLLVTGDDQFIGALMPMRLPFSDAEIAEEFAEWHRRITPPPGGPKGKPKAAAS